MAPPNAVLSINTCSSHWLRISHSIIDQHDQIYAYGRIKTSEIYLLKSPHNDFDSAITPQCNNANLWLQAKNQVLDTLPLVDLDARLENMDFITTTTLSQHEI